MKVSEFISKKSCPFIFFKQHRSIAPISLARAFCLKWAAICQLHRPEADTFESIFRVQPEAKRCPSTAVTHYKCASICCKVSFQGSMSRTRIHIGSCKPSYPGELRAAEGRGASSLSSTGKPLDWVLFLLPLPKKKLVLIRSFGELCICLPKVVQLT